MMKLYKGFTLIELMIVIAIISILGAVVSGGIFNNLGKTEARAYQNVEKFMSNNGITMEQVKRRTCAGDSDGDGYGSCAIVMKDGEKINLNCPASWSSEWQGATSCKEVDYIIK